MKSANIFHELGHSVNTIGKIPAVIRTHLFQHGNLGLAMYEGIQGAKDKYLDYNDYAASSVISWVSR